MIKIFFQIILILLLSKIIKLEEIEQLMKYSEIKIQGNTPFYLDIDKYSKGDKIYFRLYFELYSGYQLIGNDYHLYYIETDILSIDKNYMISQSYEFYRDDNHIYIPNKYKFWFSIELKENYKYLILKVPYIVDEDNNVISGYFTIEHLNYDDDPDDFFDDYTTNDDIEIIYIFLIIFVIIMIVAANIIIYRQDMKKKIVAQLNPSLNIDDEFQSKNDDLQPKIEFTYANIKIEGSTQYLNYEVQSTNNQNPSNINEISESNNKVNLTLISASIY